MKAAQIQRPTEIVVKDLPTPVPGPGEVLSKVVRCGMCGTDYSIYSGEFSFVKNGMVPFPMTPGHEWSGVVCAIGSGVDAFKIGDRVVGDTCVSCGTCYECLTGRYGYCRDMRCVGTINTWDGAYAEYMLMPARHLFHLPDSVSFDNGAMVEPAATALLSVVKAEVKTGDRVLVQGTGPIGIMAAKLAKLSGASLVMITGRKEAKLRAAVNLGVDIAVNVTRESTADVAKAHGVDYGFDCVIEASGSTDLLKESLQLVRTGGVVSSVAFYERTVDAFDIDRLVFGDVTLRGVAGSLGMFMPVLKLMASGMLDLTPLITARYSLDEVPAAMCDMKMRNEDRIKFMIDFEP